MILLKVYVALYGSRTVLFGVPVEKTAALNPKPKTGLGIR